MKAPCDKLGRPWALASKVKEGDFLVTDPGFTCMKAGARKRVRRRPGTRGLSGLFVACRCGGHTLDGQLGYRPGETGALIGFYRA